MAFVTAARINGRNKVTGTADLVVEMDPSGRVYVKLGLIRVLVRHDDWMRLVHDTLVPAEGG